MTHVSLIANNDGETVLIQCNKTAGFVFDTVSDLTIEGIQFIGCGVVNSRPAVKFDHCHGSVSNVRVGDSPFGAVYIHNSTLSFTNFKIDHNKLKYTTGSFSTVEVLKSDVRLTGTTTISENNAYALSGEDNEWIDCGTGKYEYKTIDSVTFKVANTNLTVTGTLIISKNKGLSGTMNFENSTFQMAGTSIFSENTVCIRGALSLLYSTASLSNSTYFINNTGSHSYYVGLITTAGIAMRQSTLYLDGVTHFISNKANVGTIETFASNITVDGEFVERQNSASYAAIMVRDASTMIVTGKIEFANNNLGNAVLRAESSNFTSNDKASFISNRGIAPCRAYQKGHFHFKGTTTFKNNAGILDAIAS